MRLWKAPALPLVAALLALLPSGTRAADAPAYIGIHAPLTSTSLILVPYGKDALAQGSGFVLDRNRRLLVTNRHVVGDRDKVEALFPVYENAQARVDRNFYLQKARRYRGKVLDRSERCDLALIELESMPAEVVELPLASNSLKAGDLVATSGNPGNAAHAFVYARGKVRSVEQQRLNYDNQQKVEARILEIDTERRLEPGVSGGPVINGAGELVGVVSAAPADESPVALCIDVREVRAFLGEVYRKKATAALARQDYNDAIAQSSRALGFNPDDALAFNERGAAYSYLNQLDEAIADYSAAVKLNPSLTRAWRSRGSAHYYKGDFEKAVADCTEAIKRDPDYALAYLSRSRALAQLKQFDKSRAAATKAVPLDPSLK